MASLSQIYDWFMTGKKPTQAQFWASWGSFWNKEETIPQSAISNLTATLNAKAEKAQFDAHKTSEDAHQALFELKQSLTDKGAQGGYAPLDEFTKLAAEYLNIVNDFVTGGSEALASAETVKILKGQIDAITLILTSDDINLDTVQELVDAIKNVESYLETILVNDLTTGGTTKALTAEMGKELKILIEQLSNDFLNSGGKLPLSVFLNTVTGNDATAALEDSNRPFQSINALLNALPPTAGETYTIYIVDGNVAFTRKITRRNLRFIAYKTSTLIFDGVKEADGITNANFLFSGLSGGTQYTWTFENSNIGFSCSRAFRFGHEFNTGVIFKGNIDAMVWTAGEIYVQPNSNLKINNVSNFGGTITASGNSASIVASYIEIDFLNITTNANIINQYKGVLRINNLIKTNIGTVNNIQFSIPNSSTNEITLEFKNITHNGLIETFVKNINFIDANINNLANFNFGKINAAPQTVISGTLNSTLFLDSGYFSNGAYFKNFTGKVGGATLANGIYTFENCNITCNTTLTNRWSSATLKEAVFFKGYNTITQLVASDLIGAEAETTVEVAGVVKTNAKSFGTRVKSIYSNATYKEKLFEVVVRSKSDIVNRVLDSSTTYIIDGKLVLTAGEFIEIPATGLTMVGYGFNVSGISKNVAGQSIFSSPPAVGSGDFITRDIVYNSGAGIVFNLTNVAGNNAIEMNDVNFENCASLGKLSGYRQFTGTTNGFYGCLDGIQLSGNWSGFKLTNSNVLAFGGSGTFIKKENNTLFSNRMYLDLNLSFNSGGKLCDFDETNFASDELFQINNTLLRIGGVTNESNTASAIPNITANNPRCRWTNSLGITLTAQKFQDLKSATKVWRLSVNDAGTIAAVEVT
ncbi:hypothetical protein [Flavobacterium sp. XS1P27]|uniref:hypothetical protein n=1 Tax=Flavobacterium sp. XS1P27 TaxID=3401724 RepID=UPI003AAA7351